jgi:hypothetical protein
MRIKYKNDECCIYREKIAKKKEKLRKQKEKCKIKEPKNECESKARDKIMYK